MNLTPFAIVVFLAGLLSSRDGLLRTLMLCCLFGATATLALPGLGGAPITPAVMFLPFFLWRVLMDRGATSVLRQFDPPSAGFWLLMLAIWGVTTALFVPRLFAGMTMVFSTDRASTSALSVQFLPLRPISTNATQSAYAIAGLLTFVAARALLQRDGLLARFRDTVLLLGAVNIVVAVVDVAELYLGLPSVLSALRNANYAIMAGGEVGGLKRISGTFPEASVFAAFTLPIFAFTASLWRDGVRRWYSGSVALGSFLLLIFSTSTTAYAALVGLAAGLSVLALVRLLLGTAPPRLGIAALLLWGVAVATCLVLLVRNDLIIEVWRFFELTVVRKGESTSGLERGTWNSQALRNFLETYGVGVGLGSARASSFPLVLLSNLGVLGCLLFAAFLIQIVRSAFFRPSSPDSSVTTAAGLAVLAALAAASISSTVFDLGLAFYAYAAAATSGPSRRTVVTTRHSDG